MKRFFLFPLFAALLLVLSSCGKQETAAERQAEIDRQVQQRLDAEHQTAEQQKLAQRQADLDAREQALAAKETAPAATPESTVNSNVPEPVAENDSSSSTFYRRLDPYGDWIETGTYGYVFQPRVALQSNSWRPYTNGHWVYTDAGWTWISDEPFGWATYHYGRWTRLRDVGWVWVPGEDWAPAWVSWRKGNDFVGWAPLPPEARFDRGRGIRNSADTSYGIAPEQYSFVPATEFGGRQSATVIVPNARNVTIITQTTNVTNIAYNNSTVVDRGPSYADLRARSHQPIQRLRLERTQNFNQERPVIRGEVLAMPAADLHPAKPNARPAKVKRSVPQAVPERASTPAPTAPPAKKFVRPEMAATPIASPASTPTPQPTLNPRQAKRQENRKAKKQQQQKLPNETPAASSSPAAGETPAPNKKNRRGPQPNQP